MGQDPRVYFTRHNLCFAAFRLTQYQSVGMQRVLDGEAFTKKLSVPRDLYSNVLRQLVSAFGQSLCGADGEGDPFGGPVAMRLGVGGSWSTVERTRLG